LARVPLKRAIQKMIQDPLALKILDGEILHGDHVIVDADKKSGKMRFEVSKTSRRESSGEDKKINHESHDSSRINYPLILSEDRIREESSVKTVEEPVPSLFVPSRFS